METAINSLGGMQLIEEAMKKQQLIDDYPAVKMEEVENRFLMNEMGSPYYIQDIMSSSTTGDSQSSCSSPKNISSRQDELVNFFMLHIQPSFSLFLPNHFNQLYSTNEIPAILIYAICALSLVYLPSIQTQLQSFEEEEEKIHYYHRAVQMLDEWSGRPCVEIIQTLLILVKYTESIQEGYFERSKSLISRAVELCKMLELDKITCQPTTSDSVTKKIAFYMVSRYHVLLCVEQNIELELYISKKPTSYIANNTTEVLLFPFTVTLSHIYSHLRYIAKRHDTQSEKRSDHQIVQESLAVVNLQYFIDDDIRRLPPHITLQKSLNFPADELPLNLSLQTKLVYIHHHLNTLLLHFYYAKHPLPQGSTQVVRYPSQDMAFYSASSMLRWVESLFLDPNYSFIPKGLQWLTYCSALAFSVFQLDSFQNAHASWLEEYQRALSLTHRISYMSPHNELKPFTRDLIQKPNKPRRNTISDRPMPIPPSFLQLSSADMSHLSLQPTLQLNSKRTLLRNTSQSCADLRSVHETHSRKHSGSNSSNSSISNISCTLGPYRHSSPTKTGYSKPYDNIPRQQKVKKTSSLHGISNHYNPTFSSNSIVSPVDFSPFLDTNESPDPQYTTHWNEFDMQNHHILNDERTEGHALF